MYYYDGTTIQMGHSTYINHEKVMESSGSVISAKRKYNTKYHGGVFLLHENDIISVHIPYVVHFFMDSEGSFFGAFLLKNAAEQGKQTYFSLPTAIMTKHNIINICKTMRSHSMPYIRYLFKIIYLSIE